MTTSSVPFAAAYSAQNGKLSRREAVALTNATEGTSGSMGTCIAGDEDRAHLACKPLQSCLGVARRGTLGLLAGGLAARLVGPSPALSAPAPTWPGSNWASMSPTAAGFVGSKLTSAVNYAKAKGGSGFVSRYGYQVGTWGSATQKYVVKSSTKSIGSLLISYAMQDGLDLDDTVLSHLDPEFGVPPESNWTIGTPDWRPQITLQNLLDHTAGFDKKGGFELLLFLIAHDTHSRRS